MGDDALGVVDVEGRRKLRPVVGVLRAVACLTGAVGASEAAGKRDGDQEDDQSRAVHVHPFRGVEGA